MISNISVRLLYLTLMCSFCVSICLGNIPTDLALKSSYKLDLNGSVEIKVTLQNQSLTPANLIQLKDIMPKGMEQVSVIVSHGTVTQNNSEVVWNIAAWPGGTTELLLTLKGNLSKFNDFGINEAEIVSMLDEDADSTPGNHNLCEDDISILTISQNRIFCPNLKGATELNAPEGFNQYLWYKDGVVLPNQTTKTLSKISQDGNYTYIAKATQGIVTCMQSPKAPIDLKFASAINFAAEVEQPICGQANGRIKIISTLKNLSLNINNSVFGESKVFSNLGTGTYTVRMRDSLGCETLKTFELWPSDSLKGMVEVLALPICSSKTGRIKLNAIGGTAPFLYSRNGLHYNSQNIIDTLEAGVQTFFIKDAKGCINILSYNLKAKEVTLLVNHTVKCTNSGMGQITLLASGGSAPYLYNNGKGFTTTNVFESLNGLHQYEVKDQMGCKTTYETMFRCDTPCKDTTINICYNTPVNVEINTPDTLKDIKWYKNDSLLLNANSNKLQISSFGKYYYTGIPVSTNNNASLQKSCIYNVANLPSMSFDLSTTRPTCSNKSSGSIELKNPKGNAPFVYKINNSPYQISPVFKDLNPNTYQVSMLDSYGCQISKSVSVGLEPPGKPIITSDRIKICILKKAFISASTCSSGQIQWSNGIKGSYKIEVGLGTYTAVCFDTCGVSESSNIIKVESAEEQTPFIGTSSIMDCQGEVLILTASGCSSKLLWNTGDTTKQIMIKKSGTYTVICKNICGDTQVSKTITINEIPIPVAPIIRITEVMADSLYTLSATQCNVGKLVWSSGETTLNIRKSTGSYYATCENQCEKSSQSNVIALKNNQLNSSFYITANKLLICQTDSLKLTAEGCNSQTIVWSNGMKGKSITIKPFVSTSYSAVCLLAGNTFSKPSNELKIMVISPSVPILNCIKNLVCPGDSLEISAMNCNGQVVWSDGQKGNKINIKLITNVTYRAYCQIDNCKSAWSDSLCLSVGVPQSPFISANKTNYCFGDSIYLGSQNCNDITVWSNGETGQSLTVKALSEGKLTFTAYCKSSTGQCSSSVSNSVNVLISAPEEAPSANLKLRNTCPFNTVNLENAIRSEVKQNYEFRLGAFGYSPRVSNPGMVKAGSYFLFKKDANSCLSKPAEIKVSIDSCNTVANVDLEVVKTVDTTQVPLGGIATYTVTVRNISGVVAHNIVLQDTISTALEVLLISPNSIFKKGILSAEIDSLKPSDSFKISYQTRVNSETKISNTVYISKIKESDKQMANNQSTVVINDLPKFNLIGLAKELVSVVEVDTNIFETLFKLRLVNMGNQRISKLQITDDLEKVFGSRSKILETSVDIIGGKTLIANKNYTGIEPFHYLLIDSTSYLNASDSALVMLKARIDLSDNLVNNFDNKAKVYSTSDNKIFDHSTNGKYPNPDNNADPKDNSVPTPIQIIRSIPINKLGIALSVVDTTEIDEFTQRITYMILVENKSDSTLRRVIITDSISKNFPNNVSFKRVGGILKSAKSKLDINQYFDGALDPFLTTSNSILPPLHKDTLFFSIDIKHNNFSGPYKNTASITAVDLFEKHYFDISNNGTKIITWKSDTTNIWLSAKPLDFTKLVKIPEGFSPNEDGINDFFKINLLNQNKIQDMSFYNRWGTLVFSSRGNMTDMETTGWNGRLKNKPDLPSLPDGTYYYVLTLEKYKTRHLGFITIAR